MDELTENDFKIAENIAIEVYEIFKKIDMNESLHENVLESFRKEGEKTLYKRLFEQIVIKKNLSCQKNKKLKIRCNLQCTNMLCNNKKDYCDIPVEIEVFLNYINTLLHSKYDTSSFPLIIYKKQANRAMQDIFLELNKKVDKVNQININDIIETPIAHSTKLDMLRHKRQLDIIKRIKNNEFNKEN